MSKPLTKRQIALRRCRDERNAARWAPRPTFNGLTEQALLIVAHRKDEDHSFYREHFRQAMPARPAPNYTMDNQER